MTDGRIPVERIEIVRAEGPHEECDKTVSVASFDEADALLRSWAPSVYGNGADKCDFTIVFADGQTYDGTYGLYKDPTKADLAGHVRNSLAMILGDDPKTEWFRRKYDADGARKAAALDSVTRYALPSPVELPDPEVAPRP